MTNDLVPGADAPATDPAILSSDLDPSTPDTPPEEVAAAAEPAPETPAEPAQPTFSTWGLDPDIEQALEDMAYFHPTNVQTAVYQPVRDGKDLLVQSRTGTGKTAAFGIPIISAIDPASKTVQSLILAPTRELALQVSRELTKIGKLRGVIVEPIYGGAPIGKQITNLRNGVHIVVGTPGRVLDHIGRRTLDTRHVRMFVLDECDEMLSMGFLEDIERVVSNLSKDRQTLLFSATMPDEVTRFARRQMKTPERIALSQDSISVAEIHHAYYIVSGISKTRDLLRILFAENPESAIIFCNTRDETAMVARYLQKQGLDAEPISSDLSQADRERVMKRTKDKNLRFLVATDVAARGIDISDLSHVINFSFPDSPEIYVHRTGRTGRAGKTGIALSLVGPRDLGSFWYLKLQFKIRPEERMLPPWSVLDGKLKVPLPPIGAPIPPDPIAIVTEAVKGPASDADLAVVRKLMATPDGERVLAVLVADKVRQVISRKRPQRVERDRDRERERDDRGDRGDRGDREMRGDRDDRPRWRDREDRGGGEDRPRWRDRDDRGGGGDREARGGGGEDRPRWRDRDDRGPRSDGPREGRDRDRGDFRGGRDRDRGELRGRGDRDDRRPRRDREDRPTREERPETRDTIIMPVDAVIEHAAPPIESPVEMSSMPVPDIDDAVTLETAPVAARPPRDDDDRDSRRRDRDDRRGGRRRGRDRDDRDTEAQASDAGAPATRSTVERGAPATRSTVERGALDSTVDAAAATPEPEAPAPAPARADKKRNGTDAPREFWETWADEKSTRDAERAAAPPRAPAAEKPERRSRERGERDDKRERKPRGEARADKPEKKAAAPAASSDGQVRLYVSLGKSHDASAGDVRALLARATGGDTTKIGSVMLRDSHSYVKVPAELADEIIAATHGTKHGDVDVTVERARA